MEPPKKRNRDTRYEQGDAESLKVGVEEILTEQGWASVPVYVANRHPVEDPEEKCPYKGGPHVQDAAKAAQIARRYGPDKLYSCERCQQRIDPKECGGYDAGYDIWKSHDGLPPYHWVGHWCALCVLKNGSAIVN